MNRVKLTQGQRLFDRPPVKDGAHRILGEIEHDIEVDVIGTEAGNAMIALDTGEIGYVPLPSVRLPAPTATDRIRGIVAGHYRNVGEHAFAAHLDPPRRAVPMVNADGDPILAPTTTPTRDNNPVTRVLRAAGYTK